MAQENQFPAFPVIKSTSNAENQVSEIWSSNGMTLLDYFAAKAMQGQLSNSDVAANKVFSETFCSQVAEDSYVLAKIMLEERKKYIKP